MIDSKTVRFIVIAEVLVCFVPLAGLLIMGFLFAPFVVLEMLEGRFGGTVHFAVVGCGVTGFIALIQVLKWLFGRQGGLLGRWWTLAFMLLGVLPVAALFVSAVEAVVFDRDSPWYTLPVAAAPILVAAHLAYLARQYLFVCRTQTEALKFV